MQIANMYSFLKHDLEDIENRLTEVVAADHRILHEASLQLLRAGGKRIRPVFVLLAAQFGNYRDNIEQVKSIAVALELIHMASLVHDDVVDNAEIRRGKPTVKHLYGNKVATYTGDYMLATALEMITTVPIPSIHRTLSKSLVKVVEGEIIQIEDKYNINQHLKHYLRRIKRKTALLIATSCKLGAISSGATKKQANALFRYGYNVGMSFQIIDDILDFTSDEQTLGKPTGHDLQQGNITLPVLYAMEDPLFKRELEKIFEHTSQITEDQMHQMLTKLLATDAIECSYKLSHTYLLKALQSLDHLTNEAAKKSLVFIAHKLGKRRS